MADRCRVNPRHFELSVQHGGIWRTVLDIHGEASYRVMPALLQSIEARGWEWKIEFIAGMRMGTVLLPTTKGRKPVQYRAGTDVAALLTAHLVAISSAESLIASIESATP